MTQPSDISDKDATESCGCVFCDLGLEPDELMDGRLVHRRRRGIGYSYLFCSRATPAPGGDSDLLAAMELIATMLAALNQARLYIEADEAAHGRQFGDGNVVRAAIAAAAALSAPSAPAVEGE